MDEKKEVAHLTDCEAQAFRRFRACRLACDQVLHSVVREWETVAMVQDELWSRLEKKFCLDLTGYDYEVVDGILYEKCKTHTLEKQARRAKEYVDRVLGAADDDGGE